MVMDEKKISAVIGRDTFTDKGSYCGRISDVEFDLNKFRVRTFVIDAAKGSFLASVVGGKKGVKVPFSMIKAVDDVVIIKHICAPVEEEDIIPKTEE